METSRDLFPGALEMMVLRALSQEPRHGYALVQHIKRTRLTITSRLRTDAKVYIRHTAQTIYHPTSTCRMGVDELAVVDPELRVRGVEGLRVVDASIFPSVPRGNTNAPTIAVAERAADLIRGKAPLSIGAAEAVG